MGLSTPALLLCVHSDKCPGYSPDKEDGWEPRRRHRVFAHLVRDRAARGHPLRRILCDRAREHPVAAGRALRARGARYRHVVCNNDELDREPDHRCYIPLAHGPDYACGGVRVLRGSVPTRMDFLCVRVPRNCRVEPGGGHDDLQGRVWDRGERETAEGEAGAAAGRA